MADSTRSAPSGAGVAKFFAVTFTVYAAVLVLFALVLDDAALTWLRLNTGLCYGGAIALLVVAGLMAEQASALGKRTGD